VSAGTDIAMQAPGCPRDIETETLLNHRSGARTALLSTQNRSVLQIEKKEHPMLVWVTAARQTYLRRRYREQKAEHEYCRS
jgi:hypothetical protein